MGLLALTAVVLWREVSLVEHRVDAAGLRIVDGPEIGSLAPRSIRDQDALYVFLSNRCPACHEVVADLAQRPPAGAVRLRAVRMSVGPGADAAEDVLAVLPSAVERLEGAAADRIVADLAVRATPLAIAVRNGLIVSKGYLRGRDDVDEVARPLHEPTVAAVEREAVGAA
jgi:hypothetical protein